MRKRRTKKTYQKIYNFVGSEKDHNTRDAVKYIMHGGEYSSDMLESRWADFKLWLVYLFRRWL